MSSYILINGSVDDKKWWSDLVKACSVIGDTFEIHCWHDENEAVRLALKYGKKVTSTWRDGTVIIGTITRDFLDYLTAMPKPLDKEPYNKMTPFFTIQFGKALSSEHYGSEIIISRMPEGKREMVERILSKMENCAVVHRNIRCY